MRVVQFQDEYIIYSDHLVVTEQLKPQVYIVRFHPMRGFYLSDYPDIVVNEEKVYGVHDEKVEKILDSFKDFNRNLGVILSGEKGIGKSFFVKVMAKKAIEQGHPVVVVDQFVEGIHTFLEQIEQEVVVILDEFDKTFINTNRNEQLDGPQTTLLSTIDGIGSNGKKMFVITCNELRNVNSFLINRPGRFHYHIRFDYPTEEEVRTYLRDKLDEQYWNEVEEVVGFAARVNLNYDCLRAISFELAKGRTFKSAITDLNILNVDDEKYNLRLYMSNGSIWESSNVYLDLFDKEQRIYEWFWNKEYGEGSILCTATAADAVYNSKSGGYRIAAKQLKITLERGYEWNGDIKTSKPLYLEIKKAPKRKLHYVFRKLG